MKILAVVLFICVQPATFAQVRIENSMMNQLAKLPLKCLQQEYPNKLGQLLLDSTEIASPKKLHPAFYGCFDWHSSVHGHWSLVYLLNHNPDLSDPANVIGKLTQNLSKENIAVEISYLNKKHEKSFERTYGWAWLLQLQIELDRSPIPQLRLLGENLQPLSDLLVARYLEFLPKLLYPLRVGTHSNTAFGLTMAYDYALHSKNDTLKNSIINNAKRYFLKDKNCPFAWEPGGTDFLSPCMEEINLMIRVLPRQDFLAWVKGFAPELFNKNFTWATARVSDREDGHLVHLDGLNFSRAWCFYTLAKKYPAYFAHLNKQADIHFNYSIRSVADGNYEGEHWLASFALRALEAQTK
jgi:hypothetical protein